MTLPADQPKPPLWRVMANAVFNAPASAEDVYAAEIRALADWIEQWQIDTYAVVLHDVVEVINRLRQEADRAEAGE